MRADLIESLQSPTRGIWAGLGEDVTIEPAGGGEAVEAVALWDPTASDPSGADDAAVLSEVDTFAFRRRDTDAVDAVQVGAVIERENGERYRVDGLADLEGEVVHVVVTET